MLNLESLFKSWLIEHGGSGRSSVSVIAPRGMQADGLATAVSVLGPEKGFALVTGIPDVELLIVYEDESGTLRETTSSGWKNE